jgi:hypothetical protein
MSTESHELLDMRIIGSSDWLNALQLVAWAELQLGRLEAAIRLTDELIDHSYRCADRISAHGGPMLHAITLRSLGEAQAAGIVRGRFAASPSGFPLARSLVELDPWLDAGLGTDRVRELRAQARSMTPRELQTVAHEAERRHIDLPHAAG